MSSQPTFSREFFEQNDRAAQLRNLCLTALQASGVGLETQGQDAIAAADLLDINQQLQAMGIEPGMHVIKKGDPESAAIKQKMQTDPLLLAEWAAGQIRTTLIKTVGFIDGGNPAAFVEHDELLGAGGTLILAHTRSGLDVPKLGQYMINRGVLSVLDDLLDAQAGPSHLGPKA